VTKSMFAMATAIVLISLSILLLPFFFANAMEPRSLYSGEKCGTAISGLWWGTPTSEVKWIAFREKDPKTNVSVYDWKPNYTYLFYDYAEPVNYANAKSIELWFRNDKLCVVRAEFDGKRFAKVMTIASNIYHWDYSRFHQNNQERFAEFVFVSCDTQVVALKYKMGNKKRYLVTWYYKPFCKGLIREDAPWITPK